MQRRSFLARIGLVSVAPILAGAGVMYGNVNVTPTIFSHSWMKGGEVLVYLNNVDVTKRCYAFFTSSGYGKVWLFKIDKRGSFYRNQTMDDVARESKYGRVKVTPKEV